MVLGWVVLATLLLMVALVALAPVDLEVRASTTTPRPYRVRLRWLYGLANVELSPRRAPVAPSTPRASTSRGAPLLARAARAFEVEGFLPAVVRVLRRLARSARIRRLHLDAAYGTGDPADTGRLHGAISPALALLPHRDDVRVALHPDFLEGRLDGSVHALVRVTPLRVALALVAFAATPAALRGMSRARGAP